MADLTPQILALVAGPKSVTTDGLSVVSRSVDELIAADNRGATVAAMTRNRRGLRFTSITGPRQVPVGTPADYSWPPGYWG